MLREPIDRLELALVQFRPQLSEARPDRLQILRLHVCSLRLLYKVVYLAVGQLQTGLLAAQVVGLAVLAQQNVLPELYRCGYSAALVAPQLREALLEQGVEAVVLL
jgi:hypothetical protein